MSDSWRQLAEDLWFDLFAAYAVLPPGYDDPKVQAIPERFEALWAADEMQATTNSNDVDTSLVVHDSEPQRGPE